MASSGQVDYIERRPLGKGQVITLPANKATRCPKPTLIRDALDHDRFYLKPCESFRCPACGPARRAETVRRVQLATTVARALGWDAMTLHLTLPTEVDRGHGFEWRELHARTMKQLRILRNRAHARASKFGRPKPAYLFVPEVQPKRGSIAPHLLWFGESPFPTAISDPRMEVMQGDNSERARFVRMQTREGRARSAYLEEIGWGRRHLWEPPVSAHAYAGYLTKYIAKRIGMAAGSEDPVPRGCCRFTYSRGLLPTRAQWAVIRSFMASMDLQIAELCDGSLVAGIMIDGQARRVSADRRFWTEDWFAQLHGVLMRIYGYESNEGEERVYQFAARLLALDEKRWRALGVEFGQAWDGEYKKVG